MKTTVIQRPTRSLLVGLTVLALVPPALAGEVAQYEPAGPPNLLLITLDTTRADHLGAWGWEHARTPILDELAGRGMRFVRADASVPVTLPSHASILTGLHPPRHGVRDNGTFALARAQTTVVERLRERGYDTAAVVSAAVVARRYGLDQGFGRYDDDLPATGRTVERNAVATTRAALGLLEDLRPPFLLWIHYFDPHEPYEAPAELRRELDGPTPAYDAEIAHVDRELGRILDRIPDDTVTVLVGDHGEMLGDHGELTHGIFPYRGARRVPLLLAGPGIPPGSVDCLVRTVDVAPTLLELAGAPVPDGLDGESLLPLLGSPGECADRPSYTESFQPYLSFGWYPLRSFSDGRWLLVHGPEDRLYDLESAAAETRNVASAHPERAREMRDRLVRTLEAMGETLEPEIEPDVVPTGEEAERLRSLGYVSGGRQSHRLEGELPDPHGKIPVIQDLH
ncbi:MAG: sulfatase, partial [Thermoanaerobaculia bacterium]|nr:sulfatase [Thermoanaerobaculia bacterium]